MNEIRNFFSKRARNWDRIHKANDFATAMKVSLLVKNSKNKTILEVGCGTGIMLPFLLARFREVHACDISSKMAKIAAKKYPLAKVRTLDFEKKSFYQPSYFDVIVIYNAFPHFRNPLKICQKANFLLKKGGVLIIAHSLNRKQLRLVHSNGGKIVSNHVLMGNKELSKILQISGFTNIKIKEGSDFILVAKKF